VEYVDGMRRMAIRMAVCFAAGVALTVLMTAWLVWRTEFMLFRGREAVAAVRPGWLPGSWPDPVDAKRMHGLRLGHRREQTRFPGVAIGGVSTSAVFVERADYGWPLPVAGMYTCAFATSGGRVPDGKSVTEFFGEFERAAGWRQGWQPSWSKRFVPVWPRVGLVLNSLLFGAVLCAAWTAPGVVRRRRRVRGGRCVACGYDLRGSAAGCPECGMGR
jgi:hypothetical protein